MPAASFRLRLSPCLLALPLVAVLALGAGAGFFTYRLVLETQRHALVLHAQKDQARSLLLMTRSALAAQFRHLLLRWMRWRMASGPGRCWASALRVSPPSSCRA